MMKRLFLLTLVIMQFAWSAESKRKIKKLETLALQKWVNDFVEGDQDKRNNIVVQLASTGINKKKWIEQFYVLWLNHPKNRQKALIVSQTAYQAFELMGLKKPSDTLKEIDINIENKLESIDLCFRPQTISEA